MSERGDTLLLWAVVLSILSIPVFFVVGGFVVLHFAR